MNIEPKVRLLLNRLDDATTTERVDALQELQTAAKTDPEIVGKLCMQKIVEFLREQGTQEEYEESLDLIIRLLRCRNPPVAKENTSIILADPKNIELLLDLLEHDTMAVGVMASEILTEIHNNDGEKLENQIQLCPAGLNKLLARLPDRSREEVRNQAIIFIQQLTAKNEEMKKTVVFNEGFEILFGIIQGESDIDGASVVIQDCLGICRNILTDSETCQRLFFGMGQEWTLRLSEYFTPYFLEKPSSADEDGDNVFWADKKDYARCSFLALDALLNALSTHNPKHQQIIGVDVTDVLPSAMFWVARGGPSYLVRSGLNLLFRCCDRNVAVGAVIMNMSLQLSPSVPGKNVPFPSAESSGRIHDLYFGWKPLPNDDRKCISIVSLLAERYVYALGAWCGRVPFAEAVGKSLDLIQSPAAFTNSISQMDVSTSEGFSQACLAVLDSVLSADEGITGMMIQYVLAPPPPLPDDDNAGIPMESMKPLSAILFGLILDVCSKLADPSNIHYTSNASFRSEMELAERSSNILSLIFLHGGQLARELSTALHTTHIQGAAARQPPQQVLSLVLTSVGRAARIPGTASLVAAFLRMLAVTVCDCEVATLQVLEDPANFFVIDLCSSVSEAAGVSTLVQTTAAMFLGSCYLSLKASADKKDAKRIISEDSATTRMTQSKLLGMLDAKIGLSRFTELLRKPLSAPRSGMTAVSSLSPRDIFLTVSFKAHYERLCESMRNGILEHYSTSDVVNKDSPLQQVVTMLNAKIQDLEQDLAVARANPSLGGARQTSVPAPLDQSADTIASLRAQLRNQEKLLEEYAARKKELEHELDELCTQISAAEDARDENAKTVTELRAQLVANGVRDASNTIPTDEFNVSDINNLRNKNAELQALNNALRFDKETLTQRVTAVEAAAQRTASELSSEIQDLQRQLQESTAVVATNKADETSNNDSIVIKSLIDLVGRFSSPTSDLDGLELVSKLEAALTSYEEDIRSVANHCSDVAQGLNVPELEGEEGSIVRVTSCMSAIESKLQEMNDKLHELSYMTLELERANSTIDALQEELSATKDENQMLTSSLAQMGQQHAGPTNDELVDKIAQLESALAGQKETHAKAQQNWNSESDRMIAKLGELEMERRNNMTVIDSLESQLKDQIAAASEDSDEIVTALRGRVKQQLDEITSMRDSHEAYVSITKAKVKEAADALQTMGSEKAKLQEECANLNDVSLKMYQMNESLNAQLNALKVDLDGAKSELVEKTTALELAAAAVQSLRSSSGNPSNSTSSGDQQRLQVLQAEIDRLSQQLAHEREVSASLTIDLERVTNEKNQQLEVIAGLRAQLLDAEQTVAELRSAALNFSVDSANNTKQLLAEIEHLKACLVESDCASSKLQLENNELTGSVSSLNSRTVELEASLSAANAANEQLNQRLNEAAEDVQSMTQQLSSSEEDMENLQQTMLMKSFELTAATSSIERLTLEVATLTEKISELEGKLAEAKAAKDRALDVNEAIKVQGQEVDRLNEKIEALTSQLRAKELEIYAAHELNQRREGEVAGVRATLESIESDLAYERQEHTETKKKLSSESKQLKDLHRENDRLKTDLKLLEMNSVSEPKTSSGGISQTEIKVFADDIVSWVKRFVGTNADSSQSESAFSGLTIASEISESSNALKSELSSVLGQYSDDLSSLVRNKQREIEELTLKVSSAKEELDAARAEASALLRTPSKPTDKHIDSSSESLDRSLVLATPSSVNGSAKRRVSPAVSSKELARLHADMAAERRRLQALQEEHADLLGLLAQQELELSVFRLELNSRAGNQTVLKAESKAQKLAVKKYGTYTSYRNADDDSEVEAELGVLSP